MPEADVVERHETLVRAPAEIVLDVAQGLELESIPLVRAIFWLRARLLGGTRASENRPQGLLDATTALGWGVLARRPARELVVGAVTRPWDADPTFTPIPADGFAAFSEPGLVKIVWTLEAEPLGPDLTRFRTETRALATDDVARRRFRRYWRLFGGGIRLIRRLMLPALRHEAECRAREPRSGGEARSA